MMASIDDADRAAAAKQLGSSQPKRALRERVAAIQEQAAELGTPDPDLDMKAYMDEMWGEDVPDTDVV